MDESERHVCEPGRCTLAETAEERAGHERERVVERSRRELVTWVGHDLYSPLAELRSLSEALQNGLVDDPQLYYKQIGLAVERLSVTVDDLLDLSRVPDGHPPAS